VLRITMLVEMFQNATLFYPERLFVRSQVKIQTHHMFLITPHELCNLKTPALPPTRPTPSSQISRILKPLPR
jgi:hypothetical protein